MNITQFTGRFGGKDLSVFQDQPITGYGGDLDVN